MDLALFSRILYSLRTAVFGPEDEELGKAVVRVLCHVMKPECPSSSCWRTLRAASAL